MLYLALARYRLLTSIRRSTWIFVILVIAQGIALFEPSSQSLFTRELFFQASAELYVERSSLVALIAFAFHWIVLISTCSLLGAEGQIFRKAEGDDLLATAPAKPADRFHGDVLGIFAAAMVLHLTVLPLLAFSFSLTSFPSHAFVWIELVLTVLLLVVSGGAAWRLYVKPGNTLQAGVMWGFLLILFLLLVSRTRWAAFRDAWLEFVAEPAPWTWARVVAGIDQPLLLVTFWFVAFAMLFTFFFLHSVYRRETDQ